MRINATPVRAVSAALLCLAVGAGLPASAQGPGGTLVIRAVSGDGQPILDLKREEITVRIDGRERAIAGLELVQPKRGEGAAGAAPAALPPPYATNAVDTSTGGGREFLIAVDDEGIGTGREAPVRAAITALVGTLAPNDRVGLIAMKQGGLNVPLSANHRAVIDALPRLITIGSSTEAEIDLVCRTKVMLATLGGFLQGARADRTIVFFSPALAQQQTEMRRMAPNEARDRTAVECELRADDMDALGKAAMASGAELFVVAFPDGLANQANLRFGQAGLENVAGVTGGEYIMMSGSPDAVVTRINRTAGTYYLASLSEPAVGRRYDIRVARDGVRASARPASGAASSAAAKGKASPRDMIRGQAVYRDLPIRSAAFVSRQPGGKDLRVMVLFEPEDPGTKLTAASVLLATGKGDGRAWNAQSEDLQRSPSMAVMTAQPGGYRVRVAATDAAGRAGTTDAELNIGLTEAGPMKLGSLVLSVDQSTPKLLFTAQDAQVIGFVPVYDMPAGTALTAVFELRENETSEPLGSTEGRLIDMPGDPGSKMLWGGFGLPALRPGDYLMRAVLMVDGKPVGEATRTLRKLP